MLDSKRNRLDYGELLRPPDGYRFEQAVATTYSGDLGTLLSLPIALIFAHTLEGDVTENRFQLLDAIKRFASQATIYHQKGQLHVPSKLSFLHAFLEDALVAVLPNDAFTAFHPKVWIIKYVERANDASCLFRVLVLSRNLTFDRSWDVAACVEGSPGEKIRETNRPLADFVRWLHEQHPIPGVNGFLDELMRTSFPVEYPFEKLRFRPMGIPGYLGSTLVPSSARKTLVISPFLHESTLRSLCEASQSRPLLFGQRHEMEKLSQGMLENLEPYCLSDLVVDGEYLESADEAASDLQHQNLHAKLFIFEELNQTRWLLGSANATEAARERNIEFMIEMTGISSPIRIKPRHRELVGEETGAGPFVPFDLSQGGKDVSEEVERQRLARLFEFALLQANIHGRVERTESGKNFDLHLDLDLVHIPKQQNTFLYVQPLAAKQRFSRQSLTPGLVEKHVFQNIDELEISRFVQFSIESPKGELQHEFLVKIPIAGLPNDRLDSILRKVIDTQDKFFQYLGFLLDENPSKEDLLARADHDTGHNSSQENGAAGFWVNLPVFERLMLAASRSPRKLADVDEIVRRLVNSGEDGTTVVPNEFLSFWEAFRAVIPEK